MLLRIATTALAALLCVGPATAAVIDTTGSVSLIAPPASSVEGALESNVQIFLFAEQADVTLGAALGIDVDTPGTYDNSNIPSLGGSQVPAGTRVDSYFLHYDAASGNPTSAGSVSFDTDILGVVVYAATLEASDGSLGAPGTTYIPAGTDANRGLDFGPDAFTLSADLRTLSLSIRENSNRVDQVRVVVASPGALAPEPGTALLLGAGLLGLALVGQRRSD